MLYFVRGSGASRCGCNLSIDVFFIKMTAIIPNKLLGKYFLIVSVGEVHSIEIRSIHYDAERTSLTLQEASNF